jgi:hypothetical protein
MKAWQTDEMVICDRAFSDEKNIFSAPRHRVTDEVYELGLATSIGAPKSKRT